MTNQPRYQSLEIWKRSLQLSVDLYETTQGFPDTEKFGLTSQMRRCSVSIPSNIAEGSMRNSRKDFAYFLNIALSSAAELQTQLLLAHKLSFINDKNFQKLDNEVLEIMKMISVFRKNLNQS